MTKFFSFIDIYCVIVYNINVYKIQKQQWPVKKGVMFILSLLLIPILLTGCGNGEIAEKEVVHPQVSIMQLDSLPTYTINEVGVIKPIQEIELIAKGAGTVDTVYASVGNNVKKNAILAVIDQSDQDSLTKIGLDNAKLQLNNAQNNFVSSKANNQSAVSQAEIRVSSLEELSKKLNRNLKELKGINAQNQKTIELQVENANKAYENAKTGYESTVEQMNQSWDNYYENTQSSIDSVFLNIESYWQAINDSLNPNNSQFLIWNQLPIYFGARDQQQKNKVANLYNSTRSFYETERGFYDNLDEVTEENINNVLTKTLDLTEKMNTLNMNVRILFDDSISSGSFSSSQLDALQTQMVTLEGKSLGDIVTVNQLKQGYKNLELNDNSQLIISKNNLDIASNQLKNAENELSKFEINSLSTIRDIETQIDQTEKDLLSANTNLLSAKRTAGIQGNTQEYEIGALKNQVRIAETTLNNNKIISSIDGVISEFNIDKGDYVAPGKLIGKVIKYSQVKIVFYVDRSMVQKIKLNHPIDFFVSNDKENKLNGVVAKIAPMADLMSKKFRIEAIANNKDLNLKPETFVSISMDVSDMIFDEIKTYIPINSVIVGQEEKHVFIIENNQSVKKEVTTGKVFEKWIEIKDGLTKEDQLITEGHRNLEEGVEVEVN